MLLFLAGAGAAAPSGTVPVVTILVDWDNTGTFAGPDDDITGDVGGNTPTDIAVRIGRGGAADFGSGAASGGATILVRNDAGKYTPENAAGVLAGRLKVGRRVWIVATYGGQTYGLFAGHLKRVVPDPATRMALLVCDDPLPLYDRHRDAA